MKKKILILTVTAGNGHNSAAYAMKKRLETTGEVEVKVVDIIKEYTSALNAWTVDKGYNLAVGYLRPVYDAFYNAYLKWNPEKASVCPAQASVKNLNGKLLKLIYEFEPDVIYGTALTFKNGKELLKKVEFLYDNPQELKKMKKKLVGLKTNGIETIFELIMKQGNADYSVIDKNVEFDKVNTIVNKQRKLASKKRK